MHVIYFIFIYTAAPLHLPCTHPYFDFIVDFIIDYCFIVFPSFIVLFYFEYPSCTVYLMATLFVGIVVFITNTCFGIAYLLIYLLVLPPVEPSGATHDDSCVLLLE